MSMLLKNLFKRVERKNKYLFIIKSLKKYKMTFDEFEEQCK